MRIQDALKDRFSESLATRAAYSRAACIYKAWPQGVCTPASAEDLTLCVKLCADAGLPLTMRGGGSGLAGQTVGTGIIADVSRRMNHIKAVDSGARTAVVEPGVILADLNRHLAPMGLKFSPDPSSQDFCTIGGMLANNSKGARAVKYGATVDHVLALDVLLADGSRVRLDRTPRAPEAFDHPALANAAALILERRDDILAQWPRCRANASGYNLKACLDAPPGTVDLVPLFIGSEGTLGVFLEATLALQEIPRFQCLALAGFADVDGAAQGVLAALPHSPSACEMLDQTFLDIIRGGVGSFPLPVEDGVRALLILETDGGERDEAESAMDGLLHAMASAAPLQVLRAETASEKTALWAFRKAASPLLNRGRGRLKSVRFIEDGSVPTEAIPDYLRGIRRITGARGIEAVIFGHAGDGHFHVNPFMDFRDPAHFAQLEPMVLEQARLLADLKGSLSGEHGDGRLRTPYLPVIYGGLTEVFRAIKVAIDPGEILNPGIIAPSAAEPLTKHMRFTPAYSRSPVPGKLSREEWAVEIERCHGCGTCRDFCPTAQATDDELLSSRGRAHLLQALIAGEIEPGLLKRPEIRALYESCLGCSLCAIHCPTNVDVAPLAALFREAFTPPLARLRDAFMASIPTLGERTGPALGGMLLKMAGATPLAAVGGALTGMRTDAAVPSMARAFAFDAGRLSVIEGRGRAKVVYFYGCFGNTYNPSNESSLAVAVLHALGADVVVPPQACCGVSKMSRGLLDMAAPDVAFNRQMILPYVEKGYCVVASAPSCMLALQREQRLFFPGSDADTLAAACAGLFEVIAPLMPSAGLHGVKARAVYQTPCHGAVLDHARHEIEVLGMIPGLDIVDVTTECCGLAGSFGAEARHAELSNAIAWPLAERLVRLKPDFAITPCGSCKTQDEAQTGLPVVHPLTVLAWALGIATPGVDGPPCASIVVPS